MEWQGNSEYFARTCTGTVPITFGPGAGTSVPAGLSYGNPDRYSSSVPLPRDRDQSYEDSSNRPRTYSHVSSAENASHSSPACANFFPSFLERLTEMNIQLHTLKFHNGAHLATTPRTTPLYQEVRKKMIENGASGIITTLETRGGPSDITVLTTAPNPMHVTSNYSPFYTATQQKHWPDGQIDAQSVVTIDPYVGEEIANGRIFSPMTQTVHELQHAYDQRLVALEKVSQAHLDVPDPQYKSVAEARAIQTENAFASAIGEPGRRLSYDESVPIKTMGFTSTEPET